MAPAWMDGKMDERMERRDEKKNEGGNGWMDESLKRNTSHEFVWTRNK